jgi:predicted transposase/invertase (TIGR01784 family)
MSLMATPGQHHPATIVIQIDIEGGTPMEPVPVPLTNDIVFKSVFGRDTNTHILMPLLNSVLGFTEMDRIEKAEIINPFRYGEKVNDKTVVLDIATTDSQGRHYNIEMQVEHESTFIPRVIFYHDRLYVSQLASGIDFVKLRKTLSISFVDFLLFPGFSGLHSRFSYRECEEGFTLSDIKELHFLELPKFHGESVESLSTSLEKWLHVLIFSLKYANIRVEIPASLSAEEGIEMAIDAYRKTLADRKVRNMLHLREKAELMTATKIALAREEGKAEGKAEGREEGRAEGETLGEAKGRAHGRLEEKHEMARKLAALGDDLSRISAVTGLSEDEIRVLVD